MGQGDHVSGGAAALIHFISTAFDAFSFHATAQLPLIHHPEWNRL
jgi:hypothetical protein